MTNATNDSAGILLLKNIQKHAGMQHTHVTNERNARTHTQTHKLLNQSSRASRIQWPSGMMCEVRTAMSCGPAVKRNKTVWLHSSVTGRIPLSILLAANDCFMHRRCVFMMRGRDLEPVAMTHPWCIFLMSWAWDLPTFYVPPATKVRGGGGGAESRGRKGGIKIKTCKAHRGCRIKGGCGVDACAAQVFSDLCTAVCACSG